MVAPPPEGYLAWMRRLGVPGILLCSLASCTAVVEVGARGGAAPDGDGAGGTTLGGEGPAGGAAQASHTIELALIAEGDIPATVVAVFMSDRAGALREAFNGAALPVQVEATDGDLVSYVYVAGEKPHWDSFRVTPEVTRIEESVGFVALGEVCNVAPMHLQVTIPPVEGAFDYFIETDNYGHYVTMSPGVVDVEINECDGVFDLLAYVRDSGSILSYELVQGIPFEPGTTRSLLLSLDQTTRHDFAITIDPGEGALWLGATTDWRRQPSMFPHESVNNLDVDAPAGPVLWSPSLIEPAPGYGEPYFQGVVAFDPGDACSARADFYFRGWSPPLQFSAGRLAEVRRAGTASWAFSSDGELGDTLGLSFQFDFGVYWNVLEDPARPPEELVLPTLPAELPPGFAWPDAAPELRNVGQGDAVGVQGYAETVAHAVFRDFESRGVSYVCD